MDIGNSKAKNILIIRSTHLEHFDLVFKKVREIFGQVKVSILTHPHAARALDDDLVLIIPYEKRGDFSVFKLKTLRNREDIKRGFDLIVVPFNNETGAGYLNVILLAFALRARSRMSCNVNGKLARLGYGYLVKRLLMAVFTSLCAIIGTVSLLPLILFVGAKIRKDARVSL